MIVSWVRPTWRAIRWSPLALAGAAVPGVAVIVRTRAAGVAGAWVISTQLLPARFAALTGAWFEHPLPIIIGGVAIAVIASHEGRFPWR